MNKRIKTGLLVGSISDSAFHSSLLKTNEHFELVASVEQNGKSSYSFSKQYDKVEDFFQDRELELIVINSPHDVHCQFARMALNAGKHVFVKKARKTRIDATDALILLAIKNSKFVFWFQNTDLQSQFSFVRNIIKDRVIGNIQVAYLCAKAEESVSKDAIYLPDGSDGSSSVKSVYDTGLHIIDQAVMLFGMPDELVNLSQASEAEHEFDDNIKFQLIYSKGLNVFLKGFLSTSSVHVDYILHGENGSYLEPLIGLPELKAESKIHHNERSSVRKPQETGGLLTSYTDKKILRFVSPETGSLERAYLEIYALIESANPLSGPQGQLAPAK